MDEGRASVVDGAGDGLADGAEDGVALIVVVEDAGIFSNLSKCCFPRVFSNLSPSGCVLGSALWFFSKCSIFKIGEHFPWGSSISR